MGEITELLAQPDRLIAMAERYLAIRIDQMEAEREQVENAEREQVENVEQRLA